MFETGGELVILGLAIVATWILAWAIAERRVISSVADSYELQTMRASARITHLEDALGGGHVIPTPGWGDFELPTVRVVERTPEASA